METCKTNNLEKHILVIQNPANDLVARVCDGETLLSNEWYNVKEGLCKGKTLDSIPELAEAVQSFGYSVTEHDIIDTRAYLQGREKIKPKAEELVTSITNVGNAGLFLSTLGGLTFYGFEFDTSPFHISTGCLGISAVALDFVIFELGFRLRYTLREKHAARLAQHDKEHLKQSDIVGQLNFGTSKIDSIIRTYLAYQEAIR